MKKMYLMIALLVVGYSSVAAPKVSDVIGSAYSYGEPFIFIERNVEFAIYQDGQFDFLYNPRGYKASRINSHINMSYNAGYNYDPFVQYDDFGAVIQVENVPIYYDYFGRIVQAGNVFINYNNFGRISRIGNLMIHYNPYNQYTHYSGFINGRNMRYVPQAWHHYYRPPNHNYVIVHHQPYRAHYFPNRVKYSYHKNYYNKHYNNGYKKSYYRPGDDVVVYHRGRRTESVRNIRNDRSDPSSDLSTSETRSNVTSERDANSNVQFSRSENPAVRGASRSNDDNKDSRASRTSTTTTRAIRTTERTSTTTRGVESGSNERPSAGNNVRRDGRSSGNVHKAVVPTTVRKAETESRSSGRTSTTTSERPSTSRSSRGRG